MFRSTLLTITTAFACALIATASSGCAKAEVTSTKRAGKLPRPDMIVVQSFAVTPAEVKLDRGMLATAMRDAENRAPAETEAQLGRMIAHKLQHALVEELRNSGIEATRDGPMVQPSDTTVFLSGQFVTIDQGDQSARVWLGFGLGGSQIRTRVQLAQGGKLVASGETSTRSNLKPGMLVSLGAGAAAESGAAIAVGAAGTGINETLAATVEADARRTAKEVASRIHKAYVERGWLAN